MLGYNLLMAPVFSGTDVSRNVYLPGPATWTHMFSGEIIPVGPEGLTITEAHAPLGTPLVYTRDTNQFNFTQMWQDFQQQESQIVNKFI